MILLLTTPARATTSYSEIETLVGWSTDGETHAVITVSGEIGETTELRVQHDGKTIVTFGEGSPKVPAGGVAKIDVATWAPLASFELAPVKAADRARFAAAFTLTALGRTARVAERCTAGGWQLTRMDGAIAATGKTFGCATVYGGYLHADGKHVLLKVGDHHFGSDGARGVGSWETKFVAIQLP